MNEVNQPRLFPGCRFRLFTPGDGPGKQQSKTPKNTNFFLPFLMRIVRIRIIIICIHVNTHYYRKFVPYFSDSHLVIGS